ncbi:MAG: hypothetical protein JXR49_16140 [Acidobacteria bacterium]|nr:hypothetical protein [Acidobacteriota bacterium]
MKTDISDSSYTSWLNIKSRRLAFGVIIAQLILIALVIDQFNLFPTTTKFIIQLSFVCFVVHALLPIRLRLLFFLAASLFSVFYVIGYANSLWLLVLIGSCISICHLKKAFYLKVTLLVSLGILFALFRIQWGLYPSIASFFPSFLSDTNSFFHWTDALWPIAGSMLMFRVMLYLYETEHDKSPFSLTHALSYFVMLPNVCFPLFPVVDYKRFRRNYFNEDEIKIYQRGAFWILRGFIHLLVYRFIYYNFVIDPGMVNNFSSITQFSLSAYLLYIQVSGQFHLIVGILLLFGFNLPETNHLYYFASSFNDFWRRINIYWKDFVMKIIYYPVHFRLKKFGNIPAIIIATIAVFFATWALHAYQWFWLRGEWLLAPHDLLFWCILGLFVVVNSIIEIRFGRKRSLGQGRKTIIGFLAHTCRVCATFITICTLWGMWSSDSLAQWLTMMENTENGLPIIIAVIAGLTGLAIILGKIDSALKPKMQSSRKAGHTFQFHKLHYATLALTAFLFALGYPEIYRMCPEQVSSAIEKTRFSALNRVDMIQQERGYYEDLIGVNRQNLALMSVYNKRPKDWKGETTRAREGDFITSELIPGFTGASRGVTVRVNKWGMRDREYSKSLPPGTVRLAILGASHPFGSGVENDETFENVLENLWKDDPPLDDYDNFEILNFSVGGRSPLEQPAALEQVVQEFHPAIAVLVVHPGDSWRSAAEFLPRYLPSGIKIPYKYINDVISDAGVTRKMSRFEIQQRLMPYSYRLLAGAYKEFVNVCNQHRMNPILVILPRTYESTDSETIQKEIEIGKSAGFTVLPLLDVYNEYDPSDLMIAEWDEHPNTLGHKLIADELNRKLSPIVADLAAKTHPDGETIQ